MEFKITDVSVYRTAYFTVESEDMIYNVNFEETAVMDYWIIADEEGNEINDDADLYDELVALCEAKLNEK